MVTITNVNRDVRPPNNGRTSTQLTLEQNSNKNTHTSRSPPHYHQLSLHNENYSITDNEEWGDKQTEPKTDMIRIGFQNIGPQHRSSWCHHSRSTTTHIKQGKYDAFLFVDYGLHFGKVHPEHHWNERMRPIFNNSSSITAYNTNETHLLLSPFQAGGSGITLADDLNARKSGSGVDPTGLGRWAWSRVAGKGGFITIMVAAYRPTNNRRDTGSVWNQHRRYFLSKGEDREPIAAFEHDLTAALGTWIQEGSSIIIGMDANEDVRNGVIARRLQEMGFRETVTDHNNHRSPPATQNRNRSRTPIDGIWATLNVEVRKAGYTAFGGGCPSDHRALWIDITTASTLGHRPPRLLQPVVNRLNSMDPRCWRKYCDLVTRQYKDHNIPRKVSQFASLKDQYLQAGDNDPQLRRTIITLHSEIHTSTRAIRHGVAQRI